MNPLSYLAVLPGLLAKRPKESADTATGRSGLQEQLSAYGDIGRGYAEDANQYRSDLRSASNDYLSYLKSPVGSDAQDAATLGRARESVDLAARRASARLANNPALAGSADTTGALAGIEQKRLASEASLSSRVADMNLQKREMRQKAIVDYLAAQYARNQSGFERALASQRGISGQLFGYGRQQDAYNRQDSLASTNGLMQLLAELGMGNGGNKS